MHGEFTLAWLLLGGRSPGGEGDQRPSSERLRELLADPEAMADLRQRVEADWAGPRKAQAETLAHLLWSTSCLLYRVTGGPIPVLLNRAELDQAAAATDDEMDDSAALALGKAMQRTMREQMEDLQNGRNAELLSQMEEMLERFQPGPVAPNQRYLSTKAVATMLGLSSKTVRRLFNKGQLVGKKTGNEWRATRAQIEDSPYLKGGRRRRRATLE